MRFILKGFTQEMGFRIFEFVKVDEDQTRTEYTISADLALTRRYDIRIQDLPLLCRLSLERHEAAADAASLKRRVRHPAFSRHAGRNDDRAALFEPRPAGHQGHRPNRSMPRDPPFERL